MKKYLEKTRGSIALISLLVISSFALILAVSMADSGISNGFQYLDNESSDSSYYSAEGCMEEALLRIENDSSFEGTTLSFDDWSCNIVVSGANPKTVDIILTSGDYTQTFRSYVDVTSSGHAINTSLSSWEEI